MSELKMKRDPGKKVWVKKSAQRDFLDHSVVLESSVRPKKGKLTFVRKDIYLFDRLEGFCPNQFN